MVDLRVIEGSGSPEERRAAYAEAMAADAFSGLAIEILRAVARGPDNAYRTSVALQALYERLAAADVHLHASIHEGVRDVHERLMPIGRDPYDAELRWLLQCALRLAAEMLATDGFAKGRASQRQDDFRRALESYLIEKEGSSRRGGGSYLSGLLRQLAPLPPTPSPPRVSGKRKPKKTAKPART
ncbi:hypothetical protein [Ancylobacter aquaticus]|uniref:hypothetical protein n=1 Tax=Ancylobacter aquaticus TaxID=100 RepID=UPI001045D4C2|nr:hypothetical protein [Ancylobacter aquaticus]